MRAIICTGADHLFSGLLMELIGSIRDKPEGRSMPIGVLDLGLTLDQRTELERRVDHVTEPGWDIEVPSAAGPARKGYRAMTARPFLPRYFPGYEVYLWIDADAWVQDWAAVKFFTEGAADGALTIVPEIDRAYASLYDHGETRRWMYDNYVRFFSGAAARSLWQLPIMNSGAFALHHDAPHWQSWADDLRSALSRVADFTAEQTALNHAAYSRRLRVQMLPAIFNWLVNKALPKYDPATGFFTEPLLPHQPLGIVHLSGQAKRTAHTIDYTTGGGRITTGLHYRPNRQPASDRAVQVEPRHSATEGSTLRGSGA
ncbi:MAG: hypothetical protein FJX35_22005 [Alphaproteobacteria bacterium]|nr:hypothetical protein [Alphaproteobacteria bacterium]